jgi:hypothetical protein
MNQVGSNSRLPALIQLAEDLAINLVNVSFENNIKTQNKINKYLPNIENTERKQLTTRTIFVLGAGASKVNFSNIFPTGPQAAKLIEKGFGFDNLEKDINIKKRIEEITSKLFLGREETELSFETRLTLYSKFYSSEAVRDKINEIFNLKCFPSLFNEILAHLLKNRFIEAVINFNFDETFDQALAEEIGSGQLNKVISDGDCIDYAELLDDDRLKIPLYIKPHGTFSEKSSLRYTKEQYVDIPSDIEGLMLKLFNGDIWNKKHNFKNQFDELNLVICGFEMESVEFNKSLKTTLTDFACFNTVLSQIESEIGSNHNIRRKKLNIYFFQYQKDQEYVEDNKKIPLDRIKEDLTPSDFSIKKSYEEKKEKIYEIIKNQLSLNKHTNLDPIFIENSTFTKFEIENVLNLNIINTDDNDKNLNRQIEDLFEKISSFYNSTIFEPRKTFRHKLVQDFFLGKINSVNKKYKFNSNGKEKKKYFDTKEYFLDRLKFEIIIVAYKNGGAIQLEESLKSTNRIGMYYDYYYNCPKRSKSISEILKSLNFLPRKMALNRGIFFIDKKELKNQFEILYKKLNKPKSEDIGDKLDPIKNSRGINLYPNFSDPSLHIFEGISKKNIVTTDLAFHDIKTKGFNNSDIVLIINDDYRGLSGYQESMKKCDICSIIVPKISDNKNEYKTDKDYIKENNLKCPASKKIDELYLPFNEHSRHMLVFLKLNKLEVDFNKSSAIYYYKRGLNNNVNVINFEASKNKSHKINLETLMDTFSIMWLKATYYDKEGTIPFIYHEEVKEYNNLLDKESFLYNYITKRFVEL